MVEGLPDDDEECERLKLGDLPFNKYLVGEMGENILKNLADNLIMLNELD